MQPHHQPYTLTEAQRHLYIFLVSEAKTAEREGREPERLSAVRLAARVRPARSRSVIRHSLENLQGKLPLMHHRDYKLRSTKEGHEIVFWAERKGRRLRDTRENPEDVLNWDDDTIE